MRDSNHPLYNIYMDMNRRCYQVDRHNYKHYGGRGIRICDRWRKSFTDFVSDVGIRPSPQHTLERKNNNGNYEPDNVQWATKLEQMNNMRTNVLITHDNRTQTLAQWARETGQDHEKLRRRLQIGWSISQALDPQFRRVNKVRCPKESQYSRQRCAE